MDRIQRLRRAIFAAPYEVCIERARFYTASYRETEGQHPAIRAARALAHTLDHMSLYLLDDERLVGNRSSKLVGTIIPVERGEITLVLKMDLPYLTSREFKPFHIDPADEHEFFEEIVPYWQGKTVHEQKRALWQDHGLFWPAKWGPLSWIRRYRQFGKEWVKRFYRMLIKGRLKFLKEANAALATNNPNLVNNVFDVQGHLVVGHQNLLEEGYGGLKRRAADHLARLERELRDRPPVKASPQPPSVLDPRQDFQARFSKDDGATPDQHAFLEAVVTCCEAATRFIQRFDRLAEEKAARATDADQKAELTRIAEVCARVAEDPPRTFREALQLVWFNHCMATISYGMPGVLAVGRSDQYLLPYYVADVEAGRITPEEARTYLEEFLVKLSYNLIVLPSYGKETGSELGADNAALTVGGVDREGNDAVNALSYLFMDAIENIKSMTTSFSMRVSPRQSTRQWVERVIEVFSNTTGGPAVFNDDVIVPALHRTGMSLPDARDYALIGCVEPTGAGNTFGTTSGNDVSLVGLLEMVLTRGKIRNVDQRHGPKTADPTTFTSFEEVWDAYQAHMRFVVDGIARGVDIKDRIYAEHYPNPFISMTIDGCVENAMDMTWGGARYNFNSISGRGLATAANSLVALKKVVFEDETKTMAEFLDILAHHFKGHGEFQAYLRNKLPKFGNDDDEADEVAVRLAGTFCDEVARHACLRGGQYRPGFFSYGMFIVDGFFLGATPDGRNAGEPVSNSLSPANNTERNGPTAVLNSLTKIDHAKIANGMALNMRFLPSLLASPAKRQLFADLLLVYLQNGGMHAQFNVVKQADLLDAKAHPERHLDLVVRVSGYSAYFVDLGEPVQDDILDRIQFQGF